MGDLAPAERSRGARPLPDRPAFWVPLGAMRWPFTTYATGTLLAFSLPLIALAFVLGEILDGPWWLLPAAAAAFVLSFFRDPERTAEGGEDDLIAPADGVVSDIVTLDDPALGEPSTRIGIFLSVLNVHVNRMPCAGEAIRVDHRDGGYYDARDKRAVEENEAATVVIRRPDGRQLGIRQITGKLARRIVCPVEPGNVYIRGQRYGMIRFGSRTELIVSNRDLGRVAVKIGDRTKGGHTLLAVLKPSGET
jgi:phosphatidylserine decarboxylase